VTARADLPILGFATAEEFDAWVFGQPEDSPGLLLKIAKKDSGVPTVSYSDALDVALCHGWIDGQKDRLDDEFWLQRFTPRKPRSKWSQVNCARADALVGAGRMRPAGMRQIELAKADGRWEAAYASQRTATVPEDFAAALAAQPGAQEFFAGLDSRNRYAVLYRIADAKKAATRAQRIEKYATMLAEGKKIYP
jgi:uncharacterized protein YdeI (YjbR/CyaY-like superfamily)